MATLRGQWLIADKKEAIKIMKFFKSSIKGDYNFYSIIILSDDNKRKEFLTLTKYGKTEENIIKNIIKDFKETYKIKFKKIIDDNNIKIYFKSL